jgi:hypothetical protein
MTLSSPRWERQASISSPDYADLHAASTAATSGFTGQVGIIPKSA